QPECRSGNAERDIPAQQLRPEVGLRQSASNWRIAATLNAEERTHRAARQPVAGLTNEAGFPHRAVRGDERRQLILRTLGDSCGHLRIDEGAGSANGGKGVARETTIGVEARPQTPQGRIVRVRIPRAVDSCLLAEDRKRGKPEGGLVRCELRKLPAGTVAVGVLGLDAIEDPLAEDGSLDRSTLIADGSRPRVTCPDRSERI